MSDTKDTAYNSHVYAWAGIVFNKEGKPVSCEVFDNYEDAEDWCSYTVAVLDVEDWAVMATNVHHSDKTVLVNETTPLQSFTPGFIDRKFSVFCPRSLTFKMHTGELMILTDKNELPEDFMVGCDDEVQITVSIRHRED